MTIMEDTKKALLETLIKGHIGRQNRIGMGALYEVATGRGWRHRVNDTRAIRRAITELRREGYPIASDKDSGGGYYLANSGTELEMFLGREVSRALKVLKRVGEIRRQSLPAILGQLTLEAKGGAHDDI